VRVWGIDEAVFMCMNVRNGCRHEKYSLESDNT
jgi:hypothetical protein